jgi:hypothetical protein
VLRFDLGAVIGLAMLVAVLAILAATRAPLASTHRVSSGHN